MKPVFRVGIGQDSHRFSKDKTKPLLLGGLKLDHPGLEADSDGDVVIHAICNALEQALGNDSFSVYADKMCLEEGITDSKEYLKIAIKNVKKAGYSINNLGISIEAEVPKILAIAQKIRLSLAKIMEIRTSVIGINATSGEGLTAFGRGEGIQVFVIVSLVKG